MDYGKYANLTLGPCGRLEMFLFYLMRASFCPIIIKIRGSNSQLSNLGAYIHYKSPCSLDSGWWLAKKILKLDYHGVGTDCSWFDSSFGRETKVASRAFNWG